MSKYTRTTRECRVSQLHPDLLHAIQNYFQEHQLGQLEAETLRCCETISTKKSARRPVSWLNDNPDTTIYTGMLLTAQWLIWVRNGDQSGLLLNAANLQDIKARAYSSRLTNDTGLEISGHIAGSKGHARGYIGLGPEAAVQEFCEAVRQAIAEAKPPGKQGLWSGFPFR